MFASILDDIQHRANRGYGSWLDRLAGWSVESEFAALSAPYGRLAPRDAAIVRTGKIVWGALIVANDKLYRDGADDVLPAKIIYSPSRYFAAHPGHLCDLAGSVFGLRKTDIAVPEIEAITKLVRDDYSRASNVLLPWSLSDGHEVYLTVVDVTRCSLPSRHLTDQLLPLAVAPDIAPTVVIPPARLWPRSLTRHLGLLHQRMLDADAATDRQQGPRQVPTSPMPQYPAESSAPDRFTDQVFEVSDAAAQQLKSNMVNAPDRRYVRVGTIWSGKAFQYQLHYTQQTDSTDVIIRTNGIDIAIDEEHIPFLKGTLLDYRNLDHEAGFVFRNPNAIPDRAD